MISNRVLKSSLIVVHSRAAGRFENPGVVSVLIDGDNLPQSEVVMTPRHPQEWQACIFTVAMNEYYAWKMQAPRFCQVKKQNLFLQMTLHQYYHVHPQIYNPFTAPGSIA